MQAGKNVSDINYSQGLALFTTGVFAAFVGREKCNGNLQENDDISLLFKTKRKFN